ncbi:MAG: RluA family pseudouridine synthase [bacterium]|nr:RluA family pseudouridine synthase [bacterium]
MNNPEHLPSGPGKIEHTHEFVITRGQKPERLDAFLTHSVMYATRTRVQRAIDDGTVTVNGIASRSNYKVRPGDTIRLVVMKQPPIQLIPQDIPLDVVYEDDQLLVVNKPAGLTVHPGIGNRTGTLVNAVLWHMGVREAIDLVNEDEEREEIDVEEGFPIDHSAVLGTDAVRPGIVHRLDKDTSGLMVVGKTYEASLHLSNQFFERTVSRLYEALVWGVVKNDTMLLEGDVGRSPRDRKLRAVLPRGGKYAATEITVLERYSCASLIQCKLRTGRTHQIRVHMAAQKHSVVGDPDYNGRDEGVTAIHHLYRRTAQRLLDMMPRQALHAKTLGFTHPTTGKRLEFESELPPDMAHAREFLLAEYDTDRNS